MTAFPASPQPSPITFLEVTCQGSIHLIDNMKTPLPHLQFAVLSVLASTELSGREIRERLSALGLKKAGPAFYRLMSRLEESGLVRGKYEQEIINGQIVRERFYTATARGRHARDATATFHERLIAQFRGARTVV